MLEYIYNIFFENQLYNLYRNGPCKLWLPFWCGMKDFEICSKLTNTPENLWLTEEKNIIRCSELIKNDFKSYIALFDFLIWLYFFVLIINFISMFPRYIFSFYLYRKGSLVKNKKSIRM